MTVDWDDLRAKAVEAAGRMIAADPGRMRLPKAAASGTSMPQGREASTRKKSASSMYHSMRSA